MTCVICQHEHRAEIESALLCRQWGAEGVTLESISEEFSVPVRDLQVHALMHLPVQQVAGESASLAQKMQLVEADALRNTISNYYITLVSVGQKINEAVAHGEMRLITKPLVDLYLGTGSEIRNATECLVKMNQAVNGESDSGLAALAALVTSIRGSDHDTVETVQS